MAEIESPLASETEVPFVSYAQHGEDVVLWRALSHVANGRYVDVGAADPINLSVTQAFYQRGWSGVNVEPVASYAAALVQNRPRDIVVECAAGAESGEIRFYEAVGTGLSTYVEIEAKAAAARGYEIKEISVPIERLDTILERELPDAGDIHILKIDVEGAEADVLGGIDLDRWQPWVVVVEATRPNDTESTRENFEGLLTSHGYVPTLFDGLNVFYLAPGHPELADKLSYPACPLDDFVRYASVQEVKQWQSQASNWRGAWADSEASRVLEAAEKDRQAEALRQAQKQLDAIKSSSWWRATRPGRSIVHRVRAGTATAPVVKRGPKPTAIESVSPNAVARGESWTAETALVSRLWTVLDTYDRAAAPETPLSVLLEQISDLVKADSESPGLLWLLYIAFLGSYPTDLQMQRLSADLLRDGEDALVRSLSRRASETTPSWAKKATLHLITTPFIDVSRTASSDLHTGIQRVVRETVTRWNDSQLIELGVFDQVANVWRQPKGLEEDRVLRWAQQSRGATTPADASAMPAEIIVPWRTQFVLPELSCETSRYDRILAIANWSGSPASAIFYDLIPYAFPSSVGAEITGTYSHFVSIIRSSARVSTISNSVAEDLAGLTVSFRNQGIPGPEIKPHLLPIVAGIVPDSRVKELESSVLGVPGVPLVLSVSSIEPRKNQVKILQAAERLWREGHTFQLMFIAGGGGYEVFDEELARLKGRGRPVSVRQQTSEETLWAAYKLARFSVFISISEGFGLPAAESIAMGTPVVLSNQGSMREIGEGGGAEFVDPYNLDEITDAMRRLLTDDEHLELLRKEAAGRERTTWDQYASDTWDWLVKGEGSTR